MSLGIVGWPEKMGVKTVRALWPCLRMVKMQPHIRRKISTLRGTCAAAAGG
jgi:hypothetical protein